MAVDPDRQIQQRWGQKALRRGFVVVPVLLLRLQSKLELDNSEFVVLLNLLSTWHETEKPVYLAVGQVAKNMGVSDRTIQRMLSSLEKKKFIRYITDEFGKKAVDLQNLIPLLQDAAAGD